MPYAYDPGGNRTRKVQSLPGCDRIETVYHYDVEKPEDPEEPVDYGSVNNRLMYYETFDTAGADDVLASTTYYFYSVMGNVTRVVTKLEEPGDNPRYSATRFGYASNGQAVTFVVGETWNWERCMCGQPCCEDTCEDGPCPQQPCPTDYDITYAREFRYDGARARYLNRELDPVALRTTGALVPLTSTWSDYNGDWIYGDFTIDDEWNVTYEYSYEPGVARITDPFGMYRNTEYYHGDLIRTTRDLSDGGHSVAPAVYTAFGELVDGANHRYGYAGAWGYQAHDDFAFLHIGARYYDPGAGRFMQRDPIGIMGGLNVYAYVGNTPTRWVDPFGLNNVPACQDECDVWRPFADKKTREDCYMSCIGGYWPPAPARQPPPKDFIPWPGPNPPVSPPRPPGPSPGGSWNGKAVLVLVMLLVLGVSLRKSSAMGRAGAE